MSVGVQVTKDWLDATSTRLSENLRLHLSQASQLKTILDGLADTDLTNLGYSTADISLLRAFVGDAESLYRVATGQAATSAYNFLANFAAVDPTYLY